jgi:hypothetical protein
MTATTLALYAAERRTVQSSLWIAYVEEFARKRQMDLEWMSVDSLTPPSGVIPFDRKMALRSARSNIELYSLIENRRPSIVGNWDLAAILNQEQGIMILSCRKDKWSLNEVSDAFLARWISCFETSYGFLYERRMDKGPTLFAMGMSAGLGFSPEDKSESGAISRWLHEGIYGKGYLSGKLRDVYRVNVLSEAQLSSPIGRRSLRKWIVEDVERGNLTPLIDSLSVWRIQSYNIFQIQRDLSRTGMLLGKS